MSLLKIVPPCDDRTSDTITRSLPPPLLVVQVLGEAATGGVGTAAVATPAAQQTLGGALRVAQRQLTAKLRQHPAMLPKLLKVVRCLMMIYPPYFDRMLT